MEKVAYNDDVVHDVPEDVVHDVSKDVVEDDCKGDDVNRDAIPLDVFHEVQREVMEALECSDALDSDARGRPNAVDNDDFESDTVDELQNYMRKPRYHCIQEQKRVLCLLQ